MVRANNKSLADYGLLPQSYFERSERKWIVRDVTPVEDLLGADDFQSLADLGNSYAVVRVMRIIPFELQDISRLAVTTAVPLLPLLLTIFSPEELFKRD